MTGRLADKVCIITGTGGSMGRAAALMFAREGAKIVGCDINAQYAAETEAEVKAAGGMMISVHPCDLNRMDDCQRLVKSAIDTYGRLDVLYNNAAVGHFHWIADVTEDQWNLTIDQELNLVFLLVKASWNELIKNGGSIVSTASISAWMAYRGMPGLGHAAAKAGVVAMTRQMAMEGAPHGVRANTISPGVTKTRQTTELMADPEWVENIVGRVMLKRPAEPEEIAAAALFLASDEASFITGVDLCVDGGTTAW